MTLGRGGGLDEIGAVIVIGVKLEEVKGMGDWLMVVGAIDVDGECAGVGFNVDDFDRV